MPIIFEKYCVKQFMINIISYRKELKIKFSKNNGIMSLEVMTEVSGFGTGRLAETFNKLSQKFNLVPWTAKLQYMLPHLMSQVQDW